jgi:endonuclease/exonuclease/phosphatase family metal-dependent hydrolase
MWLKLLLGCLFASMLFGAFFIGQPGPRRLPDSHERASSSLRLMTWNIGYGDLESDTRAHSKDLPAVAKLIIEHDPDAVALQELTGDGQLSTLLTLLKDRYRGQISSFGSSDRVDAVLVRDRNVQFQSFPAGGKFAVAADFRGNKQMRLVFVSAHADAFSATRRRAFTADVVDWTRRKSSMAFIAGDLNLEVSVRNKTNLFTDDAKHDSESYSYLLQYFRDLGRDAGETSLNDRRIDYILGPKEDVTLRRAQVLRGAAIGGMDHLPLIVEISF